MQDDTNTNLISLEEQLQFSIDVAFLPSLILNAQGAIQYLNDEVINLLGYSRNELIGQPIECLIPQDDRIRHTQHRIKYMKDPKTRLMGTGFDIYILNKAGLETPVEIMLHPVSIQANVYIFCTIIDVTEKKQVQAMLRESNEQLEQRIHERTLSLAKLRKTEQTLNHYILQQKNIHVCLYRNGM